MGIIGVWVGMSGVNVFYTVFLSVLDLPVLPPIVFCCYAFYSCSQFVRLPYTVYSR